MKSFLMMLTFLTRIPIKINGELNDEHFKRGIIFMPTVGIIIGLLMGAIFYLGNYFDILVISLTMWLIYIWITGGLHIDGLGDTFDGVFSNRKKEEIFEIMKDSRMGTFGTLAIFSVFASNIILSANVAIIVIVITPIIGRSCALMACSISDYAKENGIGKNFVDYCGTKELVISLLYPIFVIFAIYFLKIDIKWVKAMVVSIIATLIIATGIVKYIKGKIGGMTGDTIGCMVETTQTIFLFASYMAGELII